MQSVTNKVVSGMSPKEKALVFVQEQQEKLKSEHFQTNSQPVSQIQEASYIAQEACKEVFAYIVLGNPEYSEAVATEVLRFLLESLIITTRNNEPSNEWLDSITKGYKDLTFSCWLIENLYDELGFEHLSWDQVSSLPQNVKEPLYFWSNYLLDDLQYLVETEERDKSLLPNKNTKVLNHLLLEFVECAYSQELYQLFSPIIKIRVSNPDVIVSAKEVLLRLRQIDLQQVSTLPEIIKKKLLVELHIVQLIIKQWVEPTLRLNC